MRFQLALVTACGLFLTACHSTQPTTHLTQQFEQVANFFKPSTQGTAVKVVKGTPEVFYTQSQKKKMPYPTATTVSTKRINTTECKNSDDWYLDGFRVGKSFHSQKTEMLQQRMHFCQLSQLPQSYKQNWERGFAVGAKGNHRPVRASKKT